MFKRDLITISLIYPADLSRDQIMTDVQARYPERIAMNVVRFPETAATTTVHLNIKRTSLKGA